MSSRDFKPEVERIIAEMNSFAGTGDEAFALFSRAYTLMADLYKETIYENRFKEFPIVKGFDFLKRTYDRIVNSVPAMKMEAERCRLAAYMKDIFAILLNTLGDGIDQFPKNVDDSNVSTLLQKYDSYKQLKDCMERLDILSKNRFGGNINIGELLRAVHVAAASMVSKDNLLYFQHFKDETYQTEGEFISNFFANLSTGGSNIDTTKENTLNECIRIIEKCVNTIVSAINGDGLIRTNSGNAAKLDFSDEFVVGFEQWIRSLAGHKDHDHSNELKNVIYLMDNGSVDGDKGIINNLRNDINFVSDNYTYMADMFATKKDVLIDLADVLDGLKYKHTKFANEKYPDYINSVLFNTLPMPGTEDLKKACSDMLRVYSHFFGKGGTNYTIDDDGISEAGTNLARLIILGRDAPSMPFTPSTTP